MRCGDNDPPVTARGQVHSCVSRLRKVVVAAGVAGDLQTHATGYTIKVGPGELDADEFDRLVGQARAAAGRGDLAEACQWYRGALALWRGPALAGITSRAVQQWAAALDERRFAVVEDCVESSCGWVGRVNWWAS
jgi:DNA-binding SARP family transcriptional activator